MEYAFGAMIHRPQHADAGAEQGAILGHQRMLAVSWICCQPAISSDVRPARAQASAKASLASGNDVTEPWAQGGIGSGTSSKCRFDTVSQRQALACSPRHS